MKIKPIKATGCPPVREKSGKFGFSSRSGKSQGTVNWSGKLENLQKSGKSQGTLNHAWLTPQKLYKQT